jgi:adenine C2-methylase RlmN of 23S rRNA A2503 and tRNA A37
MVKARRLSPLPFWDEDSVLAFCEERGWKPLHAYSLWKLVLRNRPAHLSELAALCAAQHILLPTGMVEALCERFALTTSTVVESHVSEDGTTKLLVELQDGQRVEAVVIRHSGRNTLCVSSQVGRWVGTCMDRM